MESCSVAADLLGSVSDSISFPSFI